LKQYINNKSNKLRKKEEIYKLCGSNNSRIYLDQVELDITLISTNEINKNNILWNI